MKARVLYFILTFIDDESTFILENEIENDKKSYSGKRAAFVQKQAYVNLDELKGKKYTTEI